MLPMIGFASHRWLLASILILVPLASCSNPAPNERDSGSEQADASTRDASTGSAPDASIDPLDASTGAPDASIDPPDASIEPVDAGCSTRSDLSGAFTMNAQKIVFNLAPGQTGAASFHPPTGTSFTLSSTETISTPTNADHEVSISQCPGDFSAVYPCRYDAYFVGSGMSLYGGSSGGRPYECKTDPTKTWYLNVRQVVRGMPTQNSCTQGACEVRVQIQGI